MTVKPAAHTSTIHHVVLIIASFVALISMLTIMFLLQLQVFVGVRAYISGEGMWAKAQNEAVHSLEHYLVSNSEADYRSFQQAMQIPAGDLQARLELQKATPDMELARQGFLAAGNHPDDVDIMCSLFSRFQHMPYASIAIEHWTSGDRLIAELQNVAEDLHRDLASTTLTEQAARAYFNKIDTINRQLIEQETQFAGTLGKASRLANTVARSISYVLAVLFAIIGMAVSWKIINRIRSIETELINNEARLRIAATAFESQESLLITDASGTILQVNKSFLKNTGYDPEELLGKPRGS